MLKTTAISVNCSQNKGLNTKVENSITEFYRNISLYTEIILRLLEGKKSVRIDLYQKKSRI